MGGRLVHLLLLNHIVRQPRAATDTHAALSCPRCCCVRCACRHLGAIGVALCGGDCRAVRLISGGLAVRNNRCAVSAEASPARLLEARSDLPPASSILSFASHHSGQLVTSARTPGSMNLTATSCNDGNNTSRTSRVPRSLLRRWCFVDISVGMSTQGSGAHMLLLCGRSAGQR
eukprot:scaffold1425_cov333-Prasinococcus_capsulatus_cf.AAC.5